MADGSNLKKQLAELKEKFRLLRLSDQVRLRRELDRASASLGREPELADRLIGMLGARIEKAVERSLVPDELPISAHTDSIREKLGNGQVVIVCGSTGSGKTTQLPKIALAAGCGRTGRLGCTQPRRIAASSLARRGAGELGAEWGREVG